MFYLHVSNRTENLLRHLAELMRVDRQPDLFAAEMFLIQSQGMERMIGQTLADEFRSFCNFKFFLPLDFLGFVAERLDMAISPDGFQRRILTWRLDSLLRHLQGEEYLPLTNYLRGENSDLKRFQLARRLANIFDQYQIMRPEMLAGWARGVLATGHTAEAWQMALWQRLLAQPGGEVHRGMQLSRLNDRLLGQENFSQALPKRISVIGLHTMPPIFLSYLNCLARHMDIHLFLLSPCRHYWGDVQSQKTLFKRLARQKEALPQSEIDAHHPLLTALGRQGRDLQNIMLSGADFALEFSSYADPLDGRENGEASLLQRLQADLLEGRLPAGTQSPPTPNDDSIQLVSCHSKLREITVLKDNLLRLLHQNPALELRDIIVMAPDIQEYAPLLPAVFGDIQHSIADRSIRRRNSVIAAFLRFLDLFSGRFGWSELLDLLRQPVVYPQFQLASSDLDTLQQWVIGAGIRWGLSGEQRKKGGLAEFEEGSWQAGLDRLLMGYATLSEDFIDGVLPFADIEGRDALALGGLCRFIEVIEEACQAFIRSRGVGDWSQTLQRIVEQLFGDAYEEELVELRGLVAELAESIEPFHTGEVSFAVIREWFRQTAKESRSSTGFLRGQLTFCSMLPMRSIPFNVVCLIGLNDGVFPKNDNHDTFDLIGADLRPGDRSPRADDRYQFLEALLAARSNLYLSYIGQSIRTNEVIPPSVVVTELLEVLEKSYGAVDLVVTHPLHPFSRKYFTEDRKKGLFSFDGYYCKTAEILQQGAQGPAFWWQGELTETPDKISFADLLRYYSNPQRFFVKECLGIRLDTGDELPDDREMFEVTGLDQYYVEEQMVYSGLSGDMEKLCKKIQIEGQWPLGNSGYLAYEEKRRDVEQFLDRVREQQMGAKLIEMPLDLKVGEHHLFGAMANLYEKGAMLIRYGRLRGRDLLAGWIHHLVLRRLMPSAVTRIVAMDRVIGFGEEAVGPDLISLLHCFSAGCRAPSPLFVEPAFDYAVQLANPRAKTPPLDKAQRTLIRRLENGYEPEWELLFRGRKTGDLLGVEFEQLCHEIFCPLWSGADE